MTREAANPLSAASQALADKSRRLTPPGMVSCLFGRAPVEDLAKYAPDALASLATSAHEHLMSPRRPGQWDIRLLDFEMITEEHRREFTVVQVVNDDMPFLLDSTLAELTEQGYEPHLVAHPILAVKRDDEGELLEFEGEATLTPRPSFQRESLIHIHIDRIDNPAARENLVTGLQRVFCDVAVSVADWSKMRARLIDVIGDYRENPPPLPQDETDEAIAFLDWIVNDNFTILGVREYRFPDGDAAANVVEGSGLGILRDPSVKVLRRGSELVIISPEIREFLQKPRALIITKANVKSRVHRRVHLDYIGVKLFSADGVLEGELRVIGLFTANAYTNSTAIVPFLRLKVQKILERAEFDPNSHAGRALLNVLENYPRDELFQVDEDTLYQFALEIMSLSDRPRVRVLARPDNFHRFVSILVFVPKDRYDTNVRRRVSAFLAGIYEGRLSAAYPAYPEGPLARTHVIIGRDEGETPHIEQGILEKGVAAIVRTWGDALRDELMEEFGGARARQLGKTYADAFNAAYREAFDARDAIRDIGSLERLSEDRPRAVDLYRREGDPQTRVNLKVFSRGTSIALSERVPLLENLGFRVVNERTYRVTPSGLREEQGAWMHDMTLERASGGDLDIASIERPIEAALLALFRGLAESDGFNKLVIEAGLGWRDVAMVRALSRYLRQARIAYAQDYIANTLARNGKIAGMIVDHFYARFDPRAAEKRPPGEAQAKTREKIEAALAEVASLDDDRILRRFVNLIDAGLRTNYFQIGEDGHPRSTIAFKFDCARIEGLPLPRPLYEIFVYSPRVEGVHLRYGKVARGGLRWSDRPQDFRTEVLGLAKAQQVKNAVIVPVGAKGGFVPKQLPPPSDRQAWLEEGTESYRVFIRTLLQLTDNIVDGETVSPADTLRHDGDDSYLVVAADKGTATFSDTANEISLDKGHWLGDAFASGGSNGYDHKKMGITARGAWEAVKRHFREIDIDIQNEPVTVAGVGDMSGDVFGNGMLLSRALKLVAAFDHRDIFIDPDPHPAHSWEERKRLFEMQRSTWRDYNEKLISKGGGVFSRQSKSIALTSEMRKLLDLDKDRATPHEVMRAILAMQVDLMWFGGIGTYIRAESESDEEVGDRANDPIRITGSQLRAQVIGEGANLGVTQLGRIEAAQKGVRVNNDAIDNSAGVNTSDVEVNIKIALTEAERSGSLSQDSRNRFLAEMTDEVGELVLRNNYLQSLSLSLSQRRGSREIGFQRRLMQMLEHEGRLDRAVEYLPGEGELTERSLRGEGLTRPELAVLLAYAKLSLYDRLLDSPVTDDPYLGRELQRYFPKVMQKRFGEAIENHRLRREIIATQLSNAIVNRGGATVIARLVDETGADGATIAAAYAAVRETFDTIALNQALDTCDNRISGELQLSLYAQVQDLTLNRIAWFIRHVEFGTEPLEAILTRFREGIAKLRDSLEATLPEASLKRWRDNARALAGKDVDPDLAQRLTALPILFAGPDIVQISEETGRSIPEIASTYFAVDDTFKLSALVAQGREVTISDYYDGLALDRAISGVALAHRRLTTEIAGEIRDATGSEAVTLWGQNRGGEVVRIRSSVDGIVASGLSLSKLTVAASLLGDLVKN